MRTGLSVGLGFDIVLQNRGVGVLEWLQSYLPAVVIDGFAVLTILGDTAVLLALGTLVYLASDRRDGAFVLGALFVGFAVVIGTKAWFELPRPPADLRAVTAWGYGFPSGHALGATVGWGALAIVADRLGPIRRRALAAAVVVGLVALTRLALGVHYLVDVVVGVAFGLGVLGGTTRWARHEPLGLFAFGGVMAGLAVAIAGGSVESIALLGAAVGAVTSWQVVDPASRPYGPEGVVASAGVGVIGVAVGAVVVPASASVFGAAALLTAGVLIAPRFWAGPLRESDRGK